MRVACSAGALVVLTLSAGLGCRSSSSDAPSTTPATSSVAVRDPGLPPSASSAASVAPPAAAAVPSLPPISSVRRLATRLRQGGAFHPKCSGVISELSVDLAVGAFERGLCTDETRGASPDPKRPLDASSGTLTPAMRQRLQTEYGKLTAQAGPSCGTDVGRIELELELASGSTLRFVNRGTSCGAAPPDVADDLGAFHSALFAALRP